MKNEKKYRVTFSELSSNNEQASCLAKSRHLHTASGGASLKKAQENLIRKMKLGSNGQSEAIDLLMELGPDFAKKVISMDNFKLIKWAMLNNKIKEFAIMVDLLDQQTCGRMLNEGTECSLFMSFITKYSLKKDYDANDFINGAKVFLKIDAEKCKAAFEKSVFKNEQIEKDFKIVLTKTPLIIESVPGSIKLHDTNIEGVDNESTYLNPINSDLLGSETELMGICGHNSEL